MLLKIDVADVQKEHVHHELKRRRVIYHGHYMLRNGEHSDVFIYPRRMQGVFTLRVKLLYVLSQIGYDSSQTLHLSLSHEASKIIRSVHDAMKLDSRQFLYTDRESGSLVLRDKQIDLLRQRPFVILDDVVRKGKALTELTDLCAKHDLKPLSVITAINSGLQQVNGTAILSLLEYPIQQWPNKKSCLLCQKGEIPLYDPYHFERG